MNIFRSRPEPKRVPLADEATAFVGSVDLARSRSIDRMMSYRARLAGNVARDTAAIAVLDEQIERERAAMPAGEQVVDEALTELAAEIEADLDGYDPADDSRKSYDAAVEAKRKRGDKHWPTRASEQTSIAAE